MTDNLAVGVRLRESDLPLVSRGGGASTTRLVNRSIGAKTILNGITNIPPGGAIHSTITIARKVSWFCLVMVLQCWVMMKCK